MWMWITLFVILIFTVLLFCPLTVSFSYSHIESENKTDLFIKYLFIKKKIRLKKNGQNDKKNTETKKDKDGLPERTLKSYYDIYKLLKNDIFKFMKYLMGKVIVFKNINIKVDFGCNNAMATGILTGTLNGILYNIMAFFHNNFKVKDWNIDISPDFEKEKFSAWFDCIVRLKIVHIIAVALKGLKIYLKLKKELKKGRKK